MRDRSLLVMAHYDDEVISCAEYLTQHPGATIFTVCGNNPERRPTFERVLEDTLTHDMSGNFSDLALSINDIPALAKIIESILSVGKLRRIITHHPLDIHQDHHIVNQAVQVALRRHQHIELLYVKNPEGFPFEEPKWDTILTRSKYAINLIDNYSGVVKHLPKPECEYYQTVRRFSI